MSAPIARTSSQENLHAQASSATQDNTNPLADAEPTTAPAGKTLGSETTIKAHRGLWTPNIEQATHHSGPQLPQLTTQQHNNSKSL